MALLWTIIFVHTCSLLFLMFFFQRAFSYLKRYKFEESRFTLLLGFIHLKHVLVAYVLVLVIFVLLSTTFTLSIL